MDERNAALRLVIIYIILLFATVLPGCDRQQPPTAPSTTSATPGTGESSGKQSALPREITGLESPVAMAFAPDGRVFITERTGRVRVIKDGKLEKEPLASVDVPRILGYHETGLLGIAVPHDFKALPYVYVYHTYNKGDRLVNRVVRFKANATRPKPEVIIDDIPAGRIHNGGILTFGPNENLFVSTGETGDSELAQDLKSTAGKILRLNADGGIPSDNPFPGSPVYSYGHRNVFGMAIQPVTNTLFITENGPTENDEINKVMPGKNYGWPIVTGKAGNERFVDPIRVYARPVALTQAIFYSGGLYPEIKDSLVFGAYNTGVLRAIRLTGPERDDVVKDRIIADFGEQVIGVAQAPDGSIYVVGSNTVKRIDELELD